MTMSNFYNIARLNDIIIRSLVPLIDSDYILLDVPNHPNIGDNLIWEGELVFLDKYVKQKRKYSANVYNIDYTKITNEIILFHGGGNFGDLYPECQTLRLNVIENYKNNKIIILPQTVFYSDKKQLQKEAKIYNRHNNLTICVRDKLSYDILSEHIVKEKLLLLPDMAFFNDFSMKVVQAKNKVLIMHRTDQEKVDPSYINFIINSLPKDYNYLVTDWPTFSNNKYINHIVYLFSLQKIKFSRWLQKSKLFNHFVSHEYGLNSCNNRTKYIRKGVEFVNEFEYIYTTRLHGMILGILLDKKVVIVDNNYNKSINFYNTWLKDFSNIEILKQ